MRIVQEIFENEHFVDQIISRKEMDLLKEFMVLSFPCTIDGQKVNLGLKIELYDYEEV